MQFLNRVKVAIATTGTGSVTVGAASDGMLTPAQAGAVDGVASRWILEEGLDWEIFSGVPSSTATVIARTTVEKSFIGGTPGTTKMTLAGAATLRAIVSAEDMMRVDAPGRNRIINGRFNIDQRNVGVATAVADNAYWADRWRYIGEATATLTGRNTTVGGGRFNAALKFTGTTDKGGIFQVVEGINCKDLRSAAIILSANLSVSNTRLGNIKMGIAEFTGTEDSVSGDPVSAWGADGTTPTLAASWAFINTPANLNVTTTPTSYNVRATVGASANNLAVIIWNDDKSYTANDTLYITDVQIEPGSLATTYEFRSVTQELALCQRYYEKTFPIGTAPISNVGNDVGALYTVWPVANGSNIHAHWQYKVSKRVTPTITTYRPDGAGATFSGGLAVSGTGLGANENHTYIYHNAGGTTGNAIVYIHATAVAEL